MSSEETVTAYKANVLRWSLSEGFYVTDEIVIGKLCRNSHGYWAIAYLIYPDGNGTCAVKDSMVDKTTVKEIRAKKVTDKENKCYWYEEEEE